MERLTPEKLREIVPNPKDIVFEMSKTIIGQDDAKRALAILALNRGMTLLSKFGFFGSKEEYNIQKTNVLLIGDTGTGKTALVRALAKAIDCPITIFDCTSITEAGYIGGKVEDILERYYKDFTNHYSKHTGEYFDLRNAAFMDPAAAMRLILNCGIIYIDEIDKIAKRQLLAKISDDKVQSELLKFLEGCVVDLGSQSWAGRDSKKVQMAMDTKDLFFIMGGAFQGLDEQILTKRNSEHSMGFSSDLKKTDKDRAAILKDVTTQDLVDYGFKPEFIGRIPIRVGLNSMTVEMLSSIIKDSDDSPLTRYRNFFSPFGITIWLDDSGVEAISERAIEMKTGARSLNNIFFSVFEHKIFDICNLKDDICLDRKFVEDSLK